MHLMNMVHIKKVGQLGSNIVTLMMRTDKWLMVVEGRRKEGSKMLISHAWKHDLHPFHQALNHPVLNISLDFSSQPNSKAIKIPFY